MNIILAEKKSHLPNRGRGTFDDAQGHNVRGSARADRNFFLPGLLSPCLSGALGVIAPDHWSSNPAQAKAKSCWPLIIPFLESFEVFCRDKQQFRNREDTEKQAARQGTSISGQLELSRLGCSGHDWAPPPISVSLANTISWELQPRSQISMVWVCTWGVLKLFLELTTELTLFPKLFGWRRCRD